MVDLQPLAAAAASGGTNPASVTNNNNHENHSNNNYQPPPTHDDIPISATSADVGDLSLKGHHPIKVEQVQKPPRHIYE